MAMVHLLGKINYFLLELLNLVQHWFWYKIWIKKKK
jgi:hypothetical protein